MNEKPANTCESFIQWKGTDVCIDIHCRCGEHLHYDGNFAYSIRCHNCNTIWTLPTHLTLTEGTPPNGITQDTEPD